ncbi:MAG TPA: prepilin peptidase [Granulicella sp.]|nr:prepilin peptidase [Granulicella sp.]
MHARIAIAFELPAFLLGLLFGSFLNVCIARLPQAESIVHPRSRCPRCRSAIRWYDNIPLLSWILLRRRCRDCGQSIPARYPLVELATGAWFAIVASNLQATLAGPNQTPEHLAIAVLTCIATLCLGFLLLGLMVMDWQTMLLPDAFTIAGIAIGFLLVCIQAVFLGPAEDQINLSQHHIQLSSPGNVVDRGTLFLTGPEALIMGRLAAICGIALLLLAIRGSYKALRKREGMGLGDVKLLAMIAAFLGLGPAILALFAGVMSACVYAVGLLVRGRASAATRLPFGSFLAGGGLFAALFGDRILNAYLSLLR